jgi:hypothetical protein
MGARKQRNAKDQTPRPVPFAQPLDTLVRLVDRLTAAIRTEEWEVCRTGGAQIQVTHAERCEGVVAEHQYRLTLTRAQPNLQLNSDVSLLRPDRDPVPGRVVRTHGRHVWVVTEGLGDDLSGLALRSEVDWLWAAVRHRLRALWPSNGRLCRGVVTPRHGLIVDLLNARTGQRSNPIGGVGSQGDLNPEQRGAVRAILRRAVTYLWGPPGTGKTTALVAAVAALVAKARTVLVVAPSNAAADVIAARIAQRLCCHPGFDDGLVVRHGSGTGADLRGRWGDRLVPEEIARRLDRESGYTCGPHPQRHAGRAASLQEVLTALSSEGGWPMCPLLQETGRRVVRSLLLRASAPQSSAPAQASAVQVTQQAAVVVTTAHQLCFTSAAVRMYDTVIIDEAGQASLPLVLLAAAHARDAIVVAGDPRQLPPLVQARCREVKRLLGEDVFTLAGATSRTGSAVACMLVEQHRMAPEISHLISSLWYDGALRPHRSVLERPAHPVRRHHGALLFVDTGVLNPRVRRTTGRSRVNAVHVEVVREIIDGLAKAGHLPRSTSVLVTAPFTAQMSRLARAVRRFPATTVHAAQGGEADLVVLDLTDAEGAGISRFFQASRIEDEGARLLNVAASRARHALIVVGDFAHLEAHGGAVVRRFLRHVREAGRPLDRGVSWSLPQRTNYGPPESDATRHTG